MKLPSYVLASLTVLCLYSIGNPAFATTSPGTSWPEGSAHAEARSSLVAALMLLEHNDHRNAIEPLEKALSGLQLIGDHILVRLAESYAETGQYELSTNAVNSLVSGYPGSPVKQKALKIKTLNIAEQFPDKAVMAYRAYLGDYPSDDDVRFRYALNLKESGRTQEADAEFTKVFVNAGRPAEEAYESMTTREISDSQWATRAYSLMRMQAYSKAEKILKRLIKGKSPKQTYDYRKKLAKCLFRQRKYSAAAPLYVDTGELYNGARSYIRSGNEKKFNKVANRMLREHHPDTPKLLIAYANDLRRDGKNRRSRKTLEKVIKNFPEAEEQATWALGWLFYISGKYKDALDRFSFLAGKYKDDPYDIARYRYWKARATERTGRDATEIFLTITGVGYYPFLSSLRTGIQPDPPLTSQTNHNSSIDLSRADLLLEVGMLSEAARELSAISRRKLNDNDLIAVAYRMQSARKYRQAMLLALKLPEEKRNDDILYPLAYWDEVTGISSRYTLDPLLVISLMREESRFDSEAQSPVGAIGLMQLMPETAKATARRVNIRLNGNHSIFEVEKNILLGTHYLDGLLRKFKSIPASLAAYNAGEGRVRVWLREGDYEEFDEFVEDIPFKETRGYVKRILRSLFKYKTYQGDRLIDLSQIEL